MKKILINTDFSSFQIETLKKENFEVQNINVADSQLIKFINEEQFSALIISSKSIDYKQILDNCPSIQIIGQLGGEIDKKDILYAQNKGVTIVNAWTSAVKSVAEMVFAHLFSGARFLHQSNREMPLQGDTDFNILHEEYSFGVELEGKTLGILGFGKIGQEVAKKAISLGMNVLAYDIEPKKVDLEFNFLNQHQFSINIKTTSKEEVLQGSDFITIHTPPSKENVLEVQDFEFLKEGVGVINVARNNAFDENILMEYLEEGKVSFAGLDTFNGEPSPSVHLLMNENISLSPRISAYTLDSFERACGEVALQVSDFLNKK